MPDHHQPAPPITDRTVAQRGNEHGTNDGYSGQESGSFDSPVIPDVDPGAVSGGAPAKGGKHAHIDQVTGEAHGSGTPAEEYDTHSPGGRVP